MYSAHFKCSQKQGFTRRNFLKLSGITLSSPFLSPFHCSSHHRKPFVCHRFGVVTDSHYADADTYGNRYYRDSAIKMTECVTIMNEKKVDFLIELGDFKDQNEPPEEDNTISYLKTIENIFQQFHGPAYHVLGNHDMDSISKKQFLLNVTNHNVSSERSYYSFISNGLYCIVLDANFRDDGIEYDHNNFIWTETNVVSSELEWLSEELNKAQGPVIIFIHQLLDGEGYYFVNNADEVRHILQKSGKVIAVFQGHYHYGRHSCIEGIHYFTLKAMVEGSGLENNSYAIIEIYSDNTVSVFSY